MEFSWIYSIFISFPFDLFTFCISSFVDEILLSFTEIIVSPSSIPVFSYGLYFLLSVPSISDIPTTKTPLVYNFTPATLPTGITFVLGSTSTSISFTNILSNKLTFTVVLPTSFNVLLLVLDVSTVSSFILNPINWFTAIFSPWNIIILSGKFCIVITYE